MNDVKNYSHEKKEVLPEVGGDLLEHILYQWSEIINEHDQELQYIVRESHVV